MCWMPTRPDAPWVAPNPTEPDRAACLCVRRSRLRLAQIFTDGVFCYWTVRHVPYVSQVVDRLIVVRDGESGGLACLVIFIDLSARCRSQLASFWYLLYCMPWP